jgi:hypothetical protein
MDGLTQGASIEVFASHVSLGSFCNCWGAVHLNLPRALNLNEGITSKQTMINVATRCNVDGIENPQAVNVIAPDSGIKPGIREPVYDGDQIIRVTNQISGGELTVFVKQGATENNAGSAGSSAYEEVSLNNPLVAGQIVRVEQALCGHTESSDPVTVQPRPSSIPVLVVRAPLYSCGVLVPVDGVLKGAQVRVFQNGFPVGFAWADGSTMVVHIGPELIAGKSITATQRVGGIDSLPSAGVPVVTAAALPVPAVLGPLVIGSQTVQVGGVVPGAYVQVFDGGVLDGSADAVEGTVTVSLSKPHSRGAEAVVVAEADNMKQPPANQLHIKGVVPIAPTNHLNFANTGAPLFVIYGSFDADVDGSLPLANPFFIYDHSQTPKAMIFIHRARHNGFNEVWSRSNEDHPPDFTAASWPGVLSPLEHQAIAKAYISAFFQDVIFGRMGYEIYLLGPVRPPGLGGYSIHNQYQILNRLVVDNYGDADAQLGIAQKNPIKRETNTLNQAVTYTEPGMDVWFDADIRTVSHNPHDSRGGQLTWKTVDTYVNNVDTRDFSGFAVLSIRLGQQYAPPNTLNPYQESQDLLKTSGGDASVRVGSITDLPFPDERPDSVTKAPLKTVRVPLASFKAVNPSVRLDQVTGVELDFSPTPFGAVSVDDVEFSA